MPDSLTLLSRFEVFGVNHEKSVSERNKLVSEMKFGHSFTDYMASAVWTKDNQWHDKQIRVF